MAANHELKIEEPGWCGSHRCYCCPTTLQADAPHVDKDVWKMIEEKSLPVLGICYGMQEMTHSNGGKVAPGQKREYGKAMVTRAPVRESRPCATLVNGWHEAAG